MRLRTPNGFELTHIDEFIETLLTKDFACDIALPRIPHRWTLEAAGQLEPRRSVLEEEDFDMEQEELEGEARSFSFSPLFLLSREAVRSSPCLQLHLE